MPRNDVSPDAAQWLSVDGCGIGEMREYRVAYVVYFRLWACLINGDGQLR